MAVTPAFARSLQKVTAMPLTDAKIRTAKPTDKPFKLTDSAGLYLIITPKGGRWWRFDYRFAGRRKTLSLGTYPEVGLKEARRFRDDARRDVADGRDPSALRKAAKRQAERQVSDRFEAIAREWMAKKGIQWKPTHASKVALRLKNDVFPWIGDRPIAEIKAGELLELLQRVEDRGAIDSARRIHQTCCQVFNFAITTDRITVNICTPLRGSLLRVKGGHFSTITEKSKLAGVLRAFDGYEASLTVRSALQLIPLFFVRPTELRAAEWSEFDFERREWTIPGSKVKIGEDHVVPLSDQAISILEKLRPITGKGKYLFPSFRSPSRCISDNTILGAMRRLGISKDETTAHGFRSTARTLLEENLGYQYKVIELQLSHEVPDTNGRAYNRTTFLEDRHEMMQTWADYLDDLKLDQASSLEISKKPRRRRTPQDGEQGHDQLRT